MGVRRAWPATRTGNPQTPPKSSVDLSTDLGDGPFFCGISPYICILRARPELFMLEIKVQGFCGTDSLGRKVYTKGFMIKWEVEIGAC